MAAQQYQTYQKQRYRTAAKARHEIEAEALLNAARCLQAVQEGWESGQKLRLKDVIAMNRRIWGCFYESAFDKELIHSTDPVRDNIIKLANFVFKKTLDILGDPEPGKLAVLIQINRSVASGLLERNAA